jgi:hypothetical protein
MLITGQAKAWFVPPHTDAFVRGFRGHAPLLILVLMHIKQLRNVCLINTRIGMGGATDTPINNF